MEDKIKVNAALLCTWKHNTWTLYASQLFMGKVLRLYVNLNGRYKVIHGEDILYEGTVMEHAISVWNEV